MKKIFLMAALASLAMGASAQQIIEQPSALDNWSVGVDVLGSTTIKGHSFFQNFRPGFGLHVEKQVTPLFGLGFEGSTLFNTTTQNGGVSNKLIFDNTYVGTYGTYNLTNALCGYSCDPRKFSIQTVLGAGWLHTYYKNGAGYNDLGVKVGLNFNFGITDNFGISLKPSVMWNATANSNNNLDARCASFNLAVGFNFALGKSTKCVNCPPDLSAEVDALNAQVNDLRGKLNGAHGALDAEKAKNGKLAAALKECESRPAEVGTYVPATNTLSSVRYVYFGIGKSSISADQLPNVEMIANFMKNHPDSKVIIKGYASKDGNVESNIKLAKARAESVKTSLVNKYGIKASRIQAEGEGIGEMFEEESWNRVAICTLEN